ncbi:MAG: alpha/beta fold hydrolase [Proteobacteria bacterium]|nr:alpha/beta fold hydrolase [Pseudomonadota bacterium]
MGRSTESQRLPIVALHGFTGARTSWCEVSGAVAAAGSEHPPLLHTLALPGHAPGVPVPADFGAAVDQLALRLRRRLTPPVRLLGYSMGARLALGLVGRHPALVSEALLIGCHPGLDDARARRERAEQDAPWVALLRREGIAAFVAAWERRPLFASQATVAAPRLAAQRAIRLAHDPEQLALALERLGLAQMPDHGPLLRRPPLPLHLVCGARDKRFVALGRRLCAASPALTLTLLPHAGHNPLIEAPAALAALLLG